MEMPKTIESRYNELMGIVEKYPHAIPLTACARFLHMDPVSLRTAIEQGKCKFGIAWKNPDGVNRAYLIPTMQFYLWMTNQQGISM